MTGFIDFLAAFHIRSLRSIKDKDGQKGGMHECCTSKEKCAEDRIIALAAILCMEKPDACVNSNAVPTYTIGIGLESLCDRKFGQGACPCSGA